MLSDTDKLLAVVRKQEHRIRRLEAEMGQLYDGDHRHEPRTPVKVKPQKSEFKIPFTFTSFITTTGVLGIIVALVAFFTYAIANDWIGPTVQILIGVLVGLVFLILGYVFYDSHPYWASGAIGGAVLIEHLAVGFGVWYYSLLNPYAAFAGLLVLTILGVALSIRKNSLLLAYFAVIGGFAVPMVAHVYTHQVLEFSFLLVLAVGVLVLSYYKNWSSFRLASLLALLPYEANQYSTFGTVLVPGGMTPQISLVFLTLFFLAYNLISIVHSLKKHQAIAVLDVVVLNINTFASALLATKILLSVDEPISRKVLGVVFVALSLGFLIEIALLRKLSKTNITSTLYSLMSSGIILLNAGLILIFSTGNFLRFIILTLPQWVLYSVLTKKTKDNIFYDVFAQIFLALSLVWWINYLWPSGLEEATFALLGMLALLVCMLWLLVQHVHRQVYGVFAVLMGFSFCYSVSAYIPLLGEFIPIIETTILSGLWLVYTLALFISCRRMEHLKPVSTVAFVLLLVTLLKIATYDLWKLDGITRIVGFAVFGTLLLVGGLLLKND